MTIKAWRHEQSTSIATIKLEDKPEHRKLTLSILKSNKWNAASNSNQAGTEPIPQNLQQLANKKSAAKTTSSEPDINSVQKPISRSLFVHLLLSQASNLKYPVGCPVFFNFYSDEKFLRALPLNTSSVGVVWKRSGKICCNQHHNSKFAVWGCSGTKCLALQQLCRQTGDWIKHPHTKWNHSGGKSNLCLTLSNLCPIWDDGQWRDEWGNYYGTCQFSNDSHDIKLQKGLCGRNISLIWPSTNAWCCVWWLYQMM